MKKIILVFTLFLLAYPCLFAQEYKHVEKVVGYIEKQQFRKLHNQFDKTLADALGAREIKYIWTRVEKQLGKYSSHGITTFKTIDEIVQYTTPLYFEKGSIELKTSFDEKEKLSGIFFRPKAYSPPIYGQNLVYNKEDVMVTSGNYSLPGEVVLPKNAVNKPPLIIMVHGSGANDRYESIYSVMVFKDLMFGLLNRNIACLLYDKRTLVYKKNYDTSQYTIFDETVEDAVNAYNLARKRTDIDTSRIFILGHSLGGYALPLILKQCPGVKGGISMAGCSRPIEDLITDQYIYLTKLDGKVNLGERLFLRKEMKKIKFVKSDKLLKAKPKKSILGYWPTNFWKQIRNYKPVDELKAIEKPVLFLQGDRDYQVTNKDLALWKSGYLEKKDWSFISYPKLNHLFIEGEGNPNPIEYFTGGNIPIYVIEDLANWMEKQ
jgi:dienelactone hydrolase